MITGQQAFEAYFKGTTVSGVRWDSALPEARQTWEEFAAELNIIAQNSIFAYSLPSEPDNLVELMLGAYSDRQRERVYYLLNRSGCKINR